MAKVKLSKLLPSLESEDGVAHPVDVKEESAELGEAEVQQVAGSGKGDVAEAAFEVEVDGKDFTAIDDASKRQGEAIHKQFERLAETEASLEAYIGILRGAKATGGICAGAASVIKYDLQSRYPKFFSELVPSVEAHDGDKSLVVSDQLESNLGSKLKGVGKAIGDSLKKFWEWVKGIYAKTKAFLKKLLAMITGEEKKVEYLLEVEKAIVKPGAKPKALPAAPPGVKSKAADAIQLLLEDNSPPPPKRTMPKSIKVSGVGILESVENDPFGIGRYESTMLNHMFEQWLPAVNKIINHIDKAVSAESTGNSLAEDIEKFASSYKSFPATSVMGGNYIVVRDGDGLKNSMKQKDGDSKSLEELDLPTQAEARSYLQMNQILLSNIVRTEHKWGQTQEALMKLEKKFNDKWAFNTAKAPLTKVITDIMSSDMDQLLKHAWAIAVKRNQVLDTVLMIHAQGGVEDSK